MTIHHKCPCRIGKPVPKVGISIRDEAYRVMGLKPRQGNLKLVFRLVNSYAQQASHKTR